MLMPFSSPRQPTTAGQQHNTQPSSLLSAYMNQQQTQHTGYGSLGVPTLSGLPGQPTSYGKAHAQQQPAQPPAAAVPGNLLDQANKLSDTDRQLLVAFLNGESPGQLPTQGVRQILLNEEEKAGEGGSRYLEQIIFEINYQNGSWRKLRRKKILGVEPPKAT